MITTQSSTKFVALVAGVAVALSLIVGAFAAAAPAQAAALTQSQINAIISLLQSFGADATTVANVTASLNGQATSGSTGGSSVSCSFSRSLTIGSNGADVTCLQQALISMGFSIPAGATGYFGIQTQTAVASWQSSKNIAPAVGYFGPISQAAWSTMPTTPTTPTTPSTSLQGGEGSLDINDTLGDVESDVKEGDSNVNVLGVEVEAKDSDVSINRVDVDITLSGTGSTRLTNYFDTVSLWLDGKKLASMDASDGDKDGQVYSFRFSGLDGVVREDETADLYVAVDAVSSIDSDDSAKTIEVEIPEGGIRAVDAAGLSDTYVSSTDNLSETGITVSASDAGSAEVTSGDTNPDGTVVTVDESNDTTDVLVEAFDVKAKHQDITIDAIPVQLISTSSVANAPGGHTLAGVVKRATLKMDGKTIKTKTIPSSATAETGYQVLFDNLNLDISEDDTASFEVYVDLNNADYTTFATGTTLYATTTGNDGAWDVEDANGDSVTPSGSVNNSSDTLVFQTAGISATFVSSSATKSFTADSSAERDIGTFKIVFDVTAVGGDMYIDNDVAKDFDRNGTGSSATGFQYATTSNSTTGSSTTPYISASGTNSGDVSGASGYYKINEGDTRRFTLSVDVQANSGVASGVAGVQLTGINFSDTTTLGTNFYNSNMGDFKTDLLSLYSM